MRLHRNQRLGARLPAPLLGAAGLAAALAAAALLASCGSSGAAQPGEPLKTAEVRLESRGGPLVLTVEVAETAEARRAGLMGRATLSPDAGMLFVHEADVQLAFHMEGTTIPLSVALLDASGAVLEVLDLDLCPEAPCPRYRPSVPYRHALEVNQGAFARWGVEAGDRLVLGELASGPA